MASRPTRTPNIAPFGDQPWPRAAGESRNGATLEHGVRLPGRYAAAVGIALVLMTAVVVAASPAAAATVTNVSVRAEQTWTATGVVLRPGDSVTISAAGRMHFGPAPIDSVAPSGLGRRCPLPVRGAHWPAPDLSCWSLIARIGSSAPFEVGTRTTLRVDKGGELSLGVNDDSLHDDSGAWTAVVTIGLPSRNGSATPVGGVKKETSKSSSFLVVAVIALVAAVALVAVVAVIAARRRRSPTRPSRQPIRMPAPAVEDADPVEAMPSISAHGVPAADLDTAKGNIFDVEFADRASLRVGYSYFPEGTVVHCRIMHNSATAATGEFVTIGGGTTPHYVTVPLGLEVTSALEGVKVRFMWTIGDLLEYSVTREPAA
jgi:hypothetical protein